MAEKEQRYIGIICDKAEFREIGREFVDWIHPAHEPGDLSQYSD
jgi:hypothetical protein